MLKQKANSQSVSEFSESAAVISVGDESPMFIDLAASLVEIRKLDGILGYILRNNTSAIIDLTEQDKIIDYAIISSSSIDAGQALSELFDLGQAKNVAVEGKNMKMLSFTLEENKISVFMDKNVDSEKILKKLCGL